jgi:hypothetical protein
MGESHELNKYGIRERGRERGEGRRREERERFLESFLECHRIPFPLVLKR